MVLLKLIQINPGAQLDQVIDKLDLLARQIDSKLKAQALAVPEVNPNITITPSVPLVQPSAKEDVPNTSAIPEEEPHNLQAPLQVEESQTSYAPMDAVPEEAISKTWPNFLKKIEKKLPFIFALLSKGQADESNPETVLVKLYKCSAFDKSRLKTKKEELHSLCKNFLGKTLEITIMSENEPLGKPDKQKTNQRMVARNHPLVLDAQRIFDGQIIN